MRNHRRTAWILASSFALAATMVGTVSKKKTAVVSEGAVRSAASSPNHEASIAPVVEEPNDPDLRRQRWAAKLSRAVSLPSPDMVVGELIDEDPARAIIQALQAEAKGQAAMPDELQELLGPFFEAWGRKDGESALAYARQGLAGAITVRSKAALSGWAERDPKSAKAWVEDFPVGRERAALAEAVVAKLRQQDWRTAAQWAETFVSDEFGRPTVSAVLDLDDVQAKQEVIAWMMNLPAGPGSLGAVRETFENWTAYDAEGASGFLAAHPTSALRDHAVAALVRNVAGEDPKAAAAWAREIRDLPLREEVSAAMSLP